MDHKDRFFYTIHHQKVDKPASWLGLPVPSAEPGLKNYFGVTSIDQLRNAIDDDIVLIIGLITLIASFCITSYGSYIGEQLINNSH